MAITHAAAPPPTYMPCVHLEPTYMIYLKYLSRSAMTDSRRFRPTGGLFMSSTEPAKLVPTYNMRRRVKCEVVPNLKCEPPRKSAVEAPRDFIKR